MNKTKETFAAHWYRRLIHLSMIFCPIVYYYFGETIASFLRVPLFHLMLLIGLFACIIEAIRLKRGKIFFGQRPYEKHQLSATFWSTISIIIVLVLAPKHYALPIIACLCIGDPMLGEFRRYRVNVWITYSVTYICLSLIWGLSVYYYHNPLWMLGIMPLVSIAAEYPSLRYIDDNAMMLLVPLMFVIL